MADLRYSVDVNTAQAERNLAQLQKTVGGVNSAFAGLKAALAGISLGAIIGSSIRMAAAMNDLSGNTNIAISSILGLSRAIVDNGGSADIAQKGIQKFAQSIGAAVEGGTELQRAFSGVGVTMEDLATLSETDLLAKTVAGLGRVEDSTKRIRLQAQLFGREFGQVNIAGAAAGFAASVAASARYEAAIRSAGVAQDNINKNLQNFQIAILNALKPINDLVAKINVSSESFERFIKTVLLVVAASLALTKGLALINALASGLARIGGIGAGLITTVNKIGAAFFGFFKNMGRAVGILPTAYGGLTSVGFALASLSRALVRFAGLVGLIYAVAEAFIYLEKKVFQTNFIEKGVTGIAIGLEHLTRAAGQLLNLPTNLIGKLFGIENAAGLGTPLLALAEQARKAREEAEIAALRGTTDGRGAPSEIANREAAAAAAAKEKANLRDVIDKMAKRRAEISKASAAFKDQNDQILNNIILEKRFIGQTEDYIELELAREEVFRRATAETSKLREAKKLLTKDESELASVYDQQIAKIHAAAQVDAARIAKSLTGLQSLRLVEQARLKDIENTTKALEDQFARQQQLNDILSGVGQQQLAVRGQRTAGETAGLSTIQKELLEIQDRAKSAAQEAGRAFAANFEGEDGLTPERAQELALGLDQISGAFARLTLDQEAFAQRNYESSRTFQAGWDQAFTRFAESTTNTAEQTAQYFDKLTNGMANAFAKMAESGKWSFKDLKSSFKDLANSMIADFIRIMAKRAILGMMGGSGGFLSSLFGRANGGDVSGETPYIVGERGPELFIPKSAGTVISNSQLNSTGSGNKQPLSVTYNISAVDASSFRSLVARDPSFIYAITEKGRQSQPRARMA